MFNIRQLCRLTLALAIPTLTIGWAQENSDVVPDSAASVTFTINPRGDVDVSIDAYDSEGARLEQIRAVVLPCNWRLKNAGDGYLSGTCRGFLKSDGAYVKGGIPVVGLVLGLRILGAKVVSLSINGFAPLKSAPGTGWHLPQRNHRGKAVRSDSSTYLFESRSSSDLPVFAQIEMGMPWKASRFITPLAVTLFAPALLALWLRRRSERRGNRPSVVVWLNWLLNGMFLYWISALNASDMAAFTYRLHIENTAMLVAISALIFSLPPLVAVAACTILMHPAEERAEAMSAAWRGMMQTAVFLVPLGIFIAGSQMFAIDPRVAMGSLLGAYVAFKVLALVMARSTHGNIQILTQGALAQRGHEIANRAGVKLQGLYLTENRARREANAFAAGTGVVMLSRGLVENLTRREVDSVIAHETGHLRGKHTISSAAAFWVYIIVLQPAALALAVYLKLPPWVMSLPILPVGYIMGTTFLSRGREFNADKRSVELTGDPEGMIAGLARLCRLTDSPVAWGGMQGSILSHPSMHSRVLAIARQFRVDEGRALALLENPDLLETEMPHAPVLTEPAPASVSRHYELLERSILFSTFAKESFAFWARWAMNAVLIIELFCIGVVIGNMSFDGPLWSFLAFIAGLALAARTFLAVDTFLECRFLKRIRRSLEARTTGPQPGAIFVGILPGNYITLPEGYPIWDVGFLSLSPDCLTYEGEQARFSVPRSEITGLAVQKGPLSWTPTFALTVTWLGGAFSLTRPDLGTTSRRHARRFETQLREWWLGRPVPEVSFEASLSGKFPAPSLPNLSVNLMHGWRAVRMLGWRAFMLFIGAIILSQALELRSYGVVSSMVPLLVPICYVLALCPLFFRRAPAATS